MIGTMGHTDVGGGREDWYLAGDAGRVHRWGPFREPGFGVDEMHHLTGTLAYGNDQLTRCAIR